MLVACPDHVTDVERDWPDDDEVTWRRLGLPRSRRGYPSSRSHPQHLDADAFKGRNDGEGSRFVGDDDVEFGQVGDDGQR